MAEAAEIVSQETEAQVSEPETPTLPESKPEIEPNGDSPEDVRARKEYRTRKKVEEELAGEREARIRLEERLKSVEEQAKQKQQPTQEKIFTIAEVNAAVEAGNITRADADRYIDEKIIPARIDERLSRRDREAEQKAPLQRAAQIVTEYMDAVPELRNQSSDEFKKVAVRYARLVNEDGHPDDIRTQKVALELVHGSIDVVKKKAEIARINANPRTIPSDAGQGGGTRQTNGKIDISKAPAHLQTYWERTGTSEKDREVEMGYWLKNQKAK